MNDWVLAAAVAAVIGCVFVPFGRRRAYRRGYFERRTQTDRPRSERRTTIGGLAIVVAAVIGIAAARETSDVAIAVLVGGGFLFLFGLVADRGHLDPRLLLAGRAAAALA